MLEYSFAGSPEFVMCGGCRREFGLYILRCQRVVEKDLYGLERHRAKSLDGLLTRLAAKMAAYTCGQLFNARLGRPLRHLADLLL